MSLLSVTLTYRRLSRAGKYDSCPLGKCSSPSVSVGCAASPSVSENTGESPREYLAFCVPRDRAQAYASFETLIDMPMDRALVSGVFSNSPSLCVFGAITTIGLGEETKLENGSLESDHFRWTMLVSASAWLTVSATRVPGPQSGVLCILSLCLCVSHAGIFYPAPSIVGEQQERGCPFIDGKIFLVSSAYYALLHATQSSLDARVSRAETINEFVAK
ncbi:hypothetical protein EDB84DRAFT_1566352 [Lactarius hengduanensis]|nr:hypothetical protein EDB84DRAFT_1566352 [Lactarius hengduanensis]